MKNKVQRTADDILKTIDMPIKQIDVMEDDILTTLKRKPQAHRTHSKTAEPNKLIQQIREIKKKNIEDINSLNNDIRERVHDIAVKIIDQMEVDKTPIMTTVVRDEVKNELIRQIAR